MSIVTTQTIEETEEELIVRARQAADLVHTQRKRDEAVEALDKFKQAERDRSKPATSIAIGSDGRHTRNGVQQ
jgi:hypothetical protein